MKPIKTGETVRMRLPGQATWSVGTCKAMVGPRSYEILIGNNLPTKPLPFALH